VQGQEHRPPRAGLQRRGQVALAEGVEARGAQALGAVGLAEGACGVGGLVGAKARDGGAEAAGVGVGVEGQRGGAVVDTRRLSPVDEGRVEGVGRRAVQRAHEELSVDGVEGEVKGLGGGSDDAERGGVAVAEVVVVEGDGVGAVGEDVAAHGEAFPSRVVGLRGGGGAGTRGVWGDREGAVSAEAPCAPLTPM
jgi:hypothetical protein